MMKKALVVLTAALMLIIFCALLALYFAAQGPYTTKVVNHLLKRYSAHPISVYKANVQWPNHLTLQAVEIRELQDEPINIEQVDIWMNLDSITQFMPVIDNIVINGIQLQNGLPAMPMFDRFTLHQLAITHLDYSDGVFISRDTDIQITNPIFLDKHQTIPYGDIQFSAEQLYWQSEAFDNVLINAHYQEKNSTIFGASFTWREGDISTQAEQYKQGWSLINTTVDRLRLNKEQWNDVDNVNWSLIFDNIYNINSLDVLNSSIDTADLRITNADFSLENLVLNGGKWKQKEGYISFNAESIYYLNHLWLEPAFESYLDNDLISIEQLSFQFEQGNIQAIGELTPDSIYFKNLAIDGMKWTHESPDAIPEIDQYLNKLSHILIDNLQINRSQFIQIAQQPYWQFSGLSVDGSELTLMKQKQIALWDGQVRISADNASFNNVLTTQPLIMMESHNGIWLLDEAVLPLEQGLIDASARYDLSQPSQPWRLEIFADGLPFNALSQWSSLPIETDAITEFQLGLSGLGGDNLMLKHSLTGQLVGSIRDAAFIQKNNNGESYTQYFESSEIVLNADRGRIVLTPVSIKGDDLIGHLKAEVDLVDSNNNVVQLDLTTKCSIQSYNLLNNQKKQQNRCKTNNDPE